MKLPLEGVRVLDLSRVLAGPYATMVLADLGADVIKVEHPERGDDTRHWGPPFAGGESAYFLSVNRNKRSIGVDLKSTEGLEKITGLAADADVVIENLRRGALEKLGLGYEALKELNPDLIYCSITGFGPGQDEERPGYDFLIQARAGIMGITGYATTAILAALRRRDATGEGVRIEVPLFESTLGWLANRGQEFLVSGEDRGRMGNGHPTIVPYQTFDASDKQIAVAVGNDAQFGRLCEAIGREDLAADERFATNPDRVASRDELVEILQRELSERTADEWVERVRAAGVPCGPVNTLAEALADEHLSSTDMLQEIEHPLAGVLRMLASPML
ncbi:MAG: L-carnitine dehydratase/bile acid-inducible protein, partial [Rubrobacteraceae bacterium]|nr:L-carnitine dehydratase/bile acid-inducible protein [Rubrobacteraceae bacterium]